MYTQAYDILIDMSRRAPRGAMPSPEDLAGPRAAASQHVHTFRLHNAEHEALLGLADRAGLGTSALSRRIVEAYLKAHAPITQTPRNNRTRKR